VREHLEAARAREKFQPFLELAGSSRGTRKLSLKRGFQR